MIKNNYNVILYILLIANDIVIGYAKCYCHT